MHVIDTLGWGGAQRVLVDLANQTQREGHRVSVCITRTGYGMAEILHPAIQWLVLERQGRLGWRAMRSLARFVREHQVDIIQVHGRFTFVMIALMKMLGFLRAPLILHDHYGSIEIDQTVPAWFRVGARPFIGHYVGVYEKLGQWAVKAGLPQDKISVIGNALDLERFRNTKDQLCEDKDRSTDHILTGIIVAGLRYEKGIDTLLEAVARSTYPGSFTINVIGLERERDYGETCLRLAQELGVDNTVIFRGEQIDVPVWLQKADFALLPSRSESGPLVLIEYMIAGLPIVAARVGNIGARAEGFGLPGFVDPDDPAAFAEALDVVLTLRPEERRARGEIGRMIARRHFDVGQVMPQWYEVYHKVLTAS